MLLREVRQQTRPGFDQHDSGRPRIDAPEVTGKCLSCNFSYGARHLDAGWAAPDDHECEQPFALSIISNHFRLLKRGQDASANTRSIFNPFETRRNRSPVLVTEI